LITTRIIGGLGNQMFQYAAGKALAARHRTSLELDLCDFERYPLRRFGLAAFSVDASVLMTRRCNKLRLWKRRVLGRLPAGLVRTYYKERSFSYDPAWEHLGSEIYLDGYFQSERFFSGVAPTLREEFVPRSEGRNLEAVSPDHLQARESVAVHVRRGDYVSDAKTVLTHGVCSSGYYRRALTFMQDCLRAPRFYLFSDDMAWCRENLALPKDVVCVDWNDGCPEWDLYLMSKCRHHVIANSSFSWWGAWLATHPDQLVVCPRPWFDDGRLDARDLVPDRWTPIEKS
jgi:hypothetical protein